MRRTLIALLLVVVVLAVAGCGSSGPKAPDVGISRAKAQMTLRLTLGARPIWIRQAWIPGAGKVTRGWLAFSPVANPPGRECLRPPCVRKRSPVAAYTTSKTTGWSDIHPNAEPASPRTVILALRRVHENIRLAAG